MTDLLIRIFIKDYAQTDNTEVRGKYGVLAGCVGIVCNVFLFFAKMFVGIFSGSVSITADAINNLSDASSSVMTLLGFWISRKPADAKHPFGHARMEYLSGLAVAAMILLIGVRLAESSIQRIFSPIAMEFSVIVIVVLLLSITVKLWLALFNRNLGRKIHSASLQAVAADSKNDVISTAVVLLGALISHFLHWDLDGYLGLAVALFIIYNGAVLARDTISPLLGEPASQELVKMVSSEILGFDSRILGIHDLVVHDYGPGQRFASVHAELDYKTDVIAVHELLDNIERMFKEKHNIQMVIHYDPLVTDDAEMDHMKCFLMEKITQIDKRLHMHDFRMVRGLSHTNLIFDLVIPSDLKGKEDEIQKQLDLSVQGSNMTYYTVITFDSESFNTLYE